MPTGKQTFQPLSYAFALQSEKMGFICEKATQHHNECGISLTMDAPN